MVRYQCRICGHISEGVSHPLALKRYREHKWDAHPHGFGPMPRRMREDVDA